MVVITIDSPYKVEDLYLCINDDYLTYFGSLKGNIQVFEDETSAIEFYDKHRRWLMTNYKEYNFNTARVQKITLNPIKNLEEI